MKRRLWTREELILALNLYLKLPFGKLHSKTPEIIHLANLIGRTPSAVAMRLNNFASVDPYHQKRGVVGLSGGRKQVEPIWNEFIHDKEELLFESEMILAKMEQQSLDSKFEQFLSDLPKLEGKTKLQVVKARVNQRVFRQIVLANYAGKCAISDLDIPDMLVASHIIPWAKNKAERLNPENGICLSALYDRAFDQGYIGLNEQYQLVFSKALKKHHSKAYYKRYFAPYEHVRIRLPQKYQPRQAFLNFHLTHIFKG
ncbi:MAG: HNH endonuclease [Bacteroidetes bacterium]|nr:MAG: HNH endonuclease [Bacteroidota bacterium]